MATERLARDGGRPGVLSVTRSELMARIKSRDTGPERRLKALLRAQGIQFRSQRKAGRHTADFVLVAVRVAVFVHGCWWHQHRTHAFKEPHSNGAAWREKFRRNAARDRRAVRSANHAGWDVVTLWECESEVVWRRRLWRAIARRTFFDVAGVDL